MRVASFIIFICTTGRVCLENTCGIDKSHSSSVHEGTSNIENFPWLGVIIYSYGPDSDELPLTATVVLITKDLAIGSAMEIDNWPKANLRRNSRVVLGHNCSGPYIKVMEYVFHPEYGRNYYSALAMVQLESSKARAKSSPICASPHDFEDLDNVYAMTLTQDCTSSMVNIYKMQYVSLDQCRDYYRRNDLDVVSLWPKHVACAKSLHGGNCLWTSGTILVGKQAGRWHLFGFGVYGPGCEAPARFIDYNRYHGWVENSVTKIGKVAYTRMAPNHFILRRSGWKIQRWGPCDEEEKEHEMFTDYTVIEPSEFNVNNSVGEVRYNLSMYDLFEYSCIVVRVLYFDQPSDADETADITLMKYCPSPVPLCGDAKHTAIHFFLYIKFKYKAAYILNVYGRKYIDVVDTRHIYAYINSRGVWPGLPWPVKPGILV